MVWALLAAIALTVFVTYWRLPPERLYHVSNEGLAGGASRLLVLLNFPFALVGIPVLGIVVERLRRTAGVAPNTRRVAYVAAGMAALLCATVAWPGVVDQDDLDAKAVNLLPALGVATALALTVYAIARTGLGRRVGASLASWQLVAIGVLVVLGLPWLGAEVGEPLADVPGLGSFYNGGEHAVHLGHHHGGDGMYLAVIALILWPTAVRMRPSKLASALGFYLSLQLVYGLGNALQDGWLEQVVKRGWTSVEVPTVLEPRPTVAWGVLLASAVALWLLTRAALHGRTTGGSAGLA